MRGEPQDLPVDRGPGRRGWRGQGWRSHLIVFAVASGGTIGLWQLTRDPNPAPQDYGVNYWWPLWLGLVWAGVRRSVEQRGEPAGGGADRPGHSA